MIPQGPKVRKTVSTLGQENDGDTVDLNEGKRDTKTDLIIEISPFLQKKRVFITVLNSLKGQHQTLK